MTEKFGKFEVKRPGGPDVLEWVEENRRSVNANEVRIRNEAVGVDFIDTMLRSGQLPAPMPTGIGYAGVGIVEELGSQVTDLAPGDRVAYIYFMPGSYAEQCYVPTERVFKLPDQSLSPITAAGALFRGLTAWYLATELWDLKLGDVALVHAAAGGVGLLLTQWLAHRGVIVVGTVTSRTKVQTLLEYGCRYPVVSPEEDFVAKVMEVSGGRGAAVVYESIGTVTFKKSIECVRRFGLIASYGWPSGDPDISFMTLRSKGSIFATRPTVTHYTAEAEDFRRGAAMLFGLIKEGVLRIKTEHTYPLVDAAKAHEDLAAGRTTGSVVLVTSCN
jgi:NADPH2:quinone reductase